MSTVNSFAGRVAKLCDLVSKPELNGLYVVVADHNAQSDRHNVQILASPNKAGETVVLSVKEKNLTFSAPGGFGEFYPNPSVFHVWDIVHGSTERQEITSGSILDLGDGSLVKRLHIGNSVCVAGIPTLFTKVDELSPKTTFREFSTGPKEKEFDGPIEIQDIHFTQTVKCCGGGRLVTYRRCKFTGSGAGVKIQTDGRPMDVVFESCLFESSTCGVFLMNHAHVTLLNCTIRNCLHNGVVSHCSGSVTMVHSTIAGIGTGGVVVASKAGGVFEFTNCSFRDCKINGLEITSNRSITVQGCLFENCGVRGAIEIRAPKLVVVEIRDTVITDSDNGLFLNFGGMDVHLTRVEIVKCRQNGLFISPFVIGDAVLSMCHIVTNQSDIMYLANNNEFSLTEDDVLLVAKDNAELKEARQSYMDALAKTQIISMTERRVMNSIGGIAVACDNCGAVEGTNGKFKACGKCKQACYCTRECQKTHWAQHKALCARNIG